MITQDSVLVQLIRLVERIPNPPPPPRRRRGRPIFYSEKLFLKALVINKKDKEAGKVPHTSIDTEAAWTKSGWHGWVYGWKLHLAITVGGIWIPLSARLTPADVADNQIAPSLIEELPAEARFVFGRHPLRC